MFFTNEMIIYFLTVSLKPNGPAVNVCNVACDLIYANLGVTIINDFTTTIFIKSCLPVCLVHKQASWPR